MVEKTSLKFFSKILSNRQFEGCIRMLPSGTRLHRRRLHPDATFDDEGCIRMQPSMTKVASGCKLRRLHPDATFETWTVTLRIEGCIRMQPSIVRWKNVNYRRELAFIKSHDIRKLKNRIRMLQTLENSKKGFPCGCKPCSGDLSQGLIRMQPTRSWNIDCNFTKNETIISNLLQRKCNLLINI